MSAEGALGQFSGRGYICLETYRKDGRSVRTTVWFVMDLGELYIRTLGDAGKVKRLGANPRVRAAPSGFRGEPIGSWVDAIAERVDGGDLARLSDLFSDKYGIQKTMTDLVNSLRGKKYVFYRLRIGQGAPSSIPS